MVLLQHLITSSSYIKCKNIRKECYFGSWYVQQALSTLYIAKVRME